MNSIIITLTIAILATKNETNPPMIAPRCSSLSPSLLLTLLLRLGLTVSLVLKLKLKGCVVGFQVKLVGCVVGCVIGSAPAKKQKVATYNYLNNIS